MVLDVEMGENPKRCRMIDINSLRKYEIAELVKICLKYSRSVCPSVSLWFSMWYALKVQPFQL